MKIFWFDLGLKLVVYFDLFLWGNWIINKFNLEGLFIVVIFGVYRV